MAVWVEWELLWQREVGGCGGVAQSAASPWQLASAGKRDEACAAGRVVAVEHLDKKNYSRKTQLLQPVPK